MYPNLVATSLLLAALTLACQRQEFTEYTGFGYAGQYLVHDGPWPFRICQTLCRRYLECSVFTMEWIPSAIGVGYCGIINGVPSRLQLFPSYNTSIYGPVPQITTIPFNDTSCRASSERTNETICEYAIDGLMDTEWKAEGKDFVWIEINLQTPELIVEIGLDPGCDTAPQCTVWLLTFSDGRQVNITRQCDVEFCDIPVSERYPVVPAVLSDSVRMTCLEKCNTKRRPSITNLYILTPLIGQ